MQISKQCKGHCFLGLPVEIDVVEMANGNRRGGFLDRREQRRIFRTASRNKYFAHGFGDEAPVCVADALGSKLNGGSDYVLIAGASRSRGRNQLLDVIRVE